MNFEPVPSSFAQRQAVSDAGVSHFLWTTYRWMAAGLALTGLTAWMVANTPVVLMAIAGNRLIFFGLVIAEFAMVMAFSARVSRVSAGTAASMFLAYSFLNGLTLSVLFLAYTQASLTQAFLVSSASFATLSAYGAVTKRDLTPVGHFMFVGFVGILIASVVNIFMHSAALEFVVSCAGVLVFAGLTAYDNQNLKQMYRMSGGAGNLAIHGALRLYLDFINMFLFMLRLFGDRR